MSSLENTKFICVDCEATGLDVVSDRIVEVGVALFTFKETEQTFESLVNPERAIPQEVIAVHHITDAMVQGKPKIGEILPEILQLIGNYPIIGHGVRFDIELLRESCKRNNIPCSLEKNYAIDTVRLARLYGESPSNSLETLRSHFNIQDEGAHRAMSDVIVNIQVFKHLASKFSSLRGLQNALSKPIAMKNMPLGKHKGRPLKELPLEYLLWAARQNFDNDLLFSLRSEVNRRKKGETFSQSSNPFSHL